MWSGLVVVGFGKGLADVQRQQFGVELERRDCRRRRRRRVRHLRLCKHLSDTMGPKKLVRRAARPVLDYRKSNDSWTKISLHCSVHVGLERPLFTPLIQFRKACEA